MVDLAVPAGWVVDETGDYDNSMILGGTFKCSGLHHEAGWFGGLVDWQFGWLVG